MNSSIIFFEGHNIRRIYDEESEIWFFSVVDIIQALTDSVNPTDYFKKLRKRDVQLGMYVGTNCPHVEMPTSSGKKRKTLAGTAQHILRIVQSIPSPKAEPLKTWLAKVGYERMQEICNSYQHHPSRMDRSFG
jgi:DNA-damage-inducible protein D